jgi:hypothetical protein
VRRRRPFHRQDAKIAKRDAARVFHLGDLGGLAVLFELAGVDFVGDATKKGPEGPSSVA